MVFRIVYHTYVWGQVLWKNLGKNRLFAFVLWNCVCCVLRNRVPVVFTTTSLLFWTNVAKFAFFWAPCGRYVLKMGNPSPFSYWKRGLGDIYKEN